MRTHRRALEYAGEEDIWPLGYTKEKTGDTMALRFTGSGLRYHGESDTAHSIFFFRL